MITSHKLKRFLFQLNHPAHFHLFRHTIDKLTARGHEILISVKDKDILKDLVSNYQHIQISQGYRKNNPIAIVSSLTNRTKKLIKIVRNFQPDLMIGTSPEIGYVSFLTKKSSLFFSEDDVNLSNFMYLGALSCYPFFDKILSPFGVFNSVWKEKTIYYNGFQKLAYLHPNNFKPELEKLNIQKNSKLFILRLANLKAYHDTNAEGISDSLVKEVVQKLSSKGSLIISSERGLPKELNKYQFKGNIQDMHHYLYFANLFIGDSQSMAVEAAMLGTPNIRFSNFVGKISILEEIKQRYQLSIGINSNQPNDLLRTIEELIKTPNLKKEWQSRRQKMLADKIDVTAFMVWFIENYPESAKIMKENPDYQYRFK